MERNKIKLYNARKYQAVLPAPDIDELVGDAEEIIITADENEASASGETVGAITFNASGGMWYNIGPVITKNSSFAAGMISSTTTILSLDLSETLCFNMNVKISSGPNVAMYDVHVVSNLAQIDVHSTLTAKIGTGVTDAMFAGTITSDKIHVQCSSVPLGSIFTGYITSYIR